MSSVSNSNINTNRSLSPQEQTNEKYLSDIADQEVREIFKCRQTSYQFSIGSIEENPDFTDQKEYLPSLKSLLSDFKKNPDNSKLLNKVIQYAQKKGIFTIQQDFEMIKQGHNTTIKVYYILIVERPATPCRYI